jgi:cytochrome c oxidase assembly protein subunit 15
VDERRVRQLGAVTAATMFLVYAMGTLVTTTKSGHGCGDSWPLCGGKFIPSFAIATAIEFAHRVVTALVTPLVLALAAGALWYWRSRLEIRILAPAMVVALFAEAGLGAALVLLPPSPVLLAVHFASSLVLVTSVLLTALLIRELNGWDRLRDLGAPVGYRALAFGLAGFTAVVGYLGAYMRQQGVELACNQWPVCQNGSFLPGGIAGASIGFTHRLAALALMGGTAGLFYWARRIRDERPDLYRGTAWALGFVLAQAVAGAVVVFSRVAEYSQMLHAGLVALLFCTLSYVCLHTLPRPAAASEIVAPPQQTGAPATAR